MSRVTLADIAAHVGVDRSTVSRVLSNKAAEGGISAELAERITSKARELKYIPNTFAKAVREGRFSCAALLMSTVEGRSYLPSRLLDGIHDGLADADMHLTVAKVPDEKLNSDDYVPKILRTLMADGLLINYTHHLPEHLVEIVSQRNVPAVWMNTRRENFSVYPRNFDAAEAMTRRLIELGHRRIAYLDLCAGHDEVAAVHFSASDRLAGYASAMRGAGLEPWEVRPLVSCTTFAMEKAFLVPFLQRPDRPTAVVCYFSVFVPALLRAAVEAGVRVPEDLSVATFAAENYREHGLNVCAMLEPHYRMGKEAVRLLRERVARPTKNIASVGLDFEWFDMDTCVSPGSGGGGGGGGGGRGDA
jgi:LacI family transcriptional regulator